RNAHSELGGGFIFSGRRQHTSCLSDWSSDVCSSDLVNRVIPPRRNTAGLDVKARLELFDEATRRLERRQRKVRRKRRATRGWTRSEGRRVGKQRAVDSRG